jgi:hypothetical protein
VYVHLMYTISNKYGKSEIEADGHSEVFQ